RQLLNEHDDGLLDADNLTTGEYLKRWLVTAKEKTQLATYERYEQLTQQYLIPAVGRVKLSKLRPTHVEAVYNNLTRTTKNDKRIAASANTRRAAGTVLGIALQHAAEKLKLIPANPAARMGKPKAAHHEMKFMSASQAKQFLETAKESSRNYALYALA